MSLPYGDFAHPHVKASDLSFLQWSDQASAGIHDPTTREVADRIHYTTGSDDRILYEEHWEANDSGKYEDMTHESISLSDQWIYAYRGQGVDSTFAFSANIDDDHLYLLNLDSGATRAIGPLGFDKVTALDTHPDTGVLFGVDSSADQLITVDVDTGAGTPVAALSFGSDTPLGGSANTVLDMTFDGNGNLFVRDGFTRDVFLVDADTGATSNLSMGFVPTTEGLANELDLLYSLRLSDGWLVVDRIDSSPPEIIDSFIVNIFQIFPNATGSSVALDYLGNDVIFGLGDVEQPSGSTETEVYIVDTLDGASFPSLSIVSHVPGEFRGLAVKEKSPFATGIVRFPATDRTHRGADSDVDMLVDLSGTTGTNIHPAPSSDDQYVTYDEGSGGSYEVKILRVEDKVSLTLASFQVLADAHPGHPHPTFSHDGRLLAFQYTDLGQLVVAVTSNPFRRGDVNADDCVDVEDVNEIVMYLRKQEANQDDYELIYDINFDGAVNIADARRIVVLFDNARGAPCSP